jgi:hypothetical protein
MRLIPLFSQERFRHSGLISAVHWQKLDQRGLVVAAMYALYWYNPQNRNSVEFPASSPFCGFLFQE